MKIVIAGGGTGGHLFPGIALAKEFQSRFSDSDIIFVGTGKGIETQILPKEGFALQTIEIEGWVGKKFFSLLKSIAKFPKSLYQSYCILRKFQPDLVVGVGGYASGPVLVVAVLLNIKRIILEQNVIPGLTNKILGYFVHQIFGSFEGSKNYFPKNRFFCSGNPIRRDILTIRPKKEHAATTILVFGGSQGAHSINLAVIEALDFLAKNSQLTLQWIHQTGIRDFQWVKEQYQMKNIPVKVEVFIYDMAQAYGMADLVICRAGATTLAELAACGKPAILIPFPFSAHHHQEENACFLRKMGAAEVLNHRDLNGGSLSKLIEQILLTPQKLARMSEKSSQLEKKDAAEKIIKGCIQLGLVHV